MLSRRIIGHPKLQSGLLVFYHISRQVYKCANGVESKSEDQSPVHLPRFSICDHLIDLIKRVCLVGQSFSERSSSSSVQSKHTFVSI